MEKNNDINKSSFWEDRYEKNLSQREVGTFNVKLDAEVEDAQGNVYNKKTYEDLQRQGLL